MPKVNRSPAPASGLLTPEDHLALAMAPRMRAEQNWWNLPAKKEAGERIADEESAKFVHRHNDVGDAMRHAEWSARMSTEIGPLFANAAGIQHEGKNLIEAVAQNALRHASFNTYPKDGRLLTSVPQTVAESIMDLHNNAEGRQAAAQGRAIDASRLYTAPVSPRGYLAGNAKPSGYDEFARYPPYR